MNYNWEKRLLLIAEDDKFSFKFLEGFLKQTKVNIIHASDTSENAKIQIENELLTSYNNFEESKNTKESEEERFRIALLSARNNSFKHLIKKIR